MAKLKQIFGVMLVLSLFFILGCESKIENHVFKNGMKLIVLPEKNSALVAVQLMIPHWREAQKIPGQAYLCLQLMLKGAGNWDAAQLAEKIESSGVQVDVNLDHDYMQWTWTGPAEDFETWFETFWLVMEKPRLDENEFIKMKRDQIQSIKNQKNEALPQAYQALTRQMYGMAPLMGTEDSVLSLKRQDILEFYQTAIFEHVGVLGVGGSFSKSRLLDQVKKRTQKWNRRLVKPAVLSAHKPQKIQIFSQLNAFTFLYGMPAPSMHSPDYAAMKVLNVLMGGKSSSRLFSHIREAKGLGYALGSFYPSRDSESEWVAYITVDPLARALFPALFEKEIQLLKSGEIPDWEVQAAKEYLKGQFLMDHQNLTRRVWYLAWFEAMGMGSSFDQGYLKKIDAVTVADLKRVVSQYFQKPFEVGIGNEP